MKPEITLNTTKFKLTKRGIAIRPMSSTFDISPSHMLLLIPLLVLLVPYIIGLVIWNEVTRPKPKKPFPKRQK